jgi:hypothetical protein
LSTTFPECKTAEVKALQIDKDRLQAEVRGLQTQLKEGQSWHEAMLRDVIRQHKSHAGEIDANDAAKEARTH